VNCIVKTIVNCVLKIDAGRADTNDQLLKSLVFGIVEGERRPGRPVKVKVKVNVDLYSALS